MQSEGGGVDVALGDDAGGVDKGLQLGAAGDGSAVKVGERAHRLEVDVEDGVRLGQQQRGLGWCLLAQNDGDDQRYDDGGGDE